jgi:hypothetical protein
LYFHAGPPEESTAIAPIKRNQEAVISSNPRFIAQKITMRRT